MAENKFKIRMVLTLATMLTMAMLLQSIVVMSLGVRVSIREDVAWAIETLKQEAISITRSEKRGESQLALMTVVGQGVGHNKMFLCIYLEQAGEETVTQPQCRFIDKMRSLSQQTNVQQHPIVGFVGAGWNTFLFWSEVAIIAVPLVNGSGQVIGSITAERSLLPIYSRYKQNVKIALCYLLVNALMFSGLAFFRVSLLFFRPLDNLVQKAEAYRPDDQTLFLLSDNESPFRKLSTSISILFERIERDNRTLRQNVSELVDVNRELKYKNELVVRTEKLATAGRLSAGLAHEIGNPLSIIQGYVELLSRDDLTASEKKEFSARAQQELDRIKRLINQLLDFARPIRSVEENVSINTLITDVIGFVSLEKTFVKCSISTKLLAEDDTIVVDKDALRQVLINCLFNAMDATAAMKDTKRVIVITTSHEQSSTRDPLLTILVQDNGTGIAQEQLEYIFDPFFTTKELGRGTGLGLFVCHTIIQRLDGTISLCNLSPTGVEVRIVLPLRKQSPPKSKK
jgi:two-component system, NtrC family, sensor kinase